MTDQRSRQAMTSGWRPSRTRWPLVFTMLPPGPTAQTVTVTGVEDGDAPRACPSTSVLGADYGGYSTLSDATVAVDVDRRRRRGPGRGGRPAGGDARPRHHRHLSRWCWRPRPTAAVTVTDQRSRRGDSECGDGPGRGVVGVHRPRTWADGADGDGHRRRGRRRTTDESLRHRRGPRRRRLRGGVGRRTVAVDVADNDAVALVVEGGALDVVVDAGADLHGSLWRCRTEPATGVTISVAVESGDSTECRRSVAPGRC